MSEEPQEAPEKEQPTPCLDPIAKVQARNTLVSWYNERKEDVAQMKQQGTVSPEWIQNYETVLTSVEKEITRLDDTPECPIPESKEAAKKEATPEAPKE